MITKITQKLLTSKRNRPGTKCNVRKGIVIHYTGNTSRGATALANRNYFNNTNTYASTHFLVDDKQIIQAIPLNEVAWSVGAKSYTSIGKKLFHNGLQPNYTTVSIEMCVNGDSTYNEVVENTVWLVVYLLKQFNLTINDIYRHYDITGKSCPLFYLKQSDWNNFLSKVKDALGDVKRNEAIKLDKAIIKTIKTIQTLNIRKGPSGEYDVIKTVPIGTELQVYENLKGWYNVGNGWVNGDSKYSKEIASSNEDHMSTTSPLVNLVSSKGRVKVNSSLNIRQQPNTTSKIVGLYTNNTEITLLEEKGNWYRTDKGWVFGDYVERIDERRFGVLVNNANIRKSDGSIITTGKQGEECIIFPGTIKVKGIELVPVKYKDIKGYIQQGSVKLK